MKSWRTPSEPDHAAEQAVELARRADVGLEGRIDRRARVDQRPAHAGERGPLSARGSATGARTARSCRSGCRPGSARDRA